MKLGSQIRKLRGEHNLSQEELAERIFVSRQSISNWENDKTYPDIKSLLLLSEVFSVSLDTLIKGDVEKMKWEIDAQEYSNFQRDGRIFTVLLVLLLVLPAPLAHFLDYWALAVIGVLFGVLLVFSLRLEKYKKKYDIQTYKEILAFTEGKPLSDIEKAREEGKRPYQQIMMAICGAVLVVIFAAAMTLLLRWLGLI